MCVCVCEREREREREVMSFIKQVRKTNATCAQTKNAVSLVYADNFINKQLHRTIIIIREWLCIY